MKIRIVVATFDDGTRAIVGPPDYESDVAAERMAGTVRDSWSGVTDATVMNEIPAIKIRLSNGRRILREGA